MSVSVILQEAEESMAAGAWDEAIEKLQVLSQSEAKSAEVFERLAQANAIRGRFLTVLSVYLEWADTALEQAEFEQAEKALAYAKALRPDSPEVHEMGVKIARQNVDLELLSERLLELANLYLERGEGDRSLALVQEAIQVKPDDASLPLQLAEFYVSLGQISSAVRQYEEYIAKHADCGTPEKLLEPLRRLRILKTEDKDSLLQLGRVCLTLGKIDEAEEHFRAVLKLDLKNWEALLELAAICQEKGLFRNGLLAVNRALSLQPDMPLAHRRVAEIHLASGDPTAAVEAFMKSARAYTEAADIPAAADVYKAILRIDPQNSQVLSSLAGLNVNMEDFSDSLFPPMEEPEPEKSMKVEAPPDPEVRDLEESKIRTKRRPDLVPKSQLRGEAGGRPVLRRKMGGSATPGFLREGLGLKDMVAGKPVLKPTRPVTVEAEPVLEDDVRIVSPELVKPIDDEPRPESIGLDQETTITSQEAPSSPEEIDFSIPSFEELFEIEPLFEEEAEAEVVRDADVVAEEELIAEAEVVAEEPIFPGPVSEVDAAPIETAPELVPQADPEFLFPLEDDIESIFEGFECGLIDFEEEVEAQEEPEETEEPGHDPLFPLDALEEESSHILEDVETVENSPVETAMESGQESSELTEIFEIGLIDFEEQASLEQTDRPEVQEPDPELLFPLEDFENELSTIFEDFQPVEDSSADTTLDSEQESIELTEILASTIPSAPSRLEPPQDIEEDLSFVPVSPREPEPVEVVPEPEPEPVEILELDAATQMLQYRTLLEQTPTDESALESLAELCLRFGLLEEALALYQRLSKVNPGSIKTLGKVVKTALWMEDYELVKSGLWKAAELHFNRGNLALCRERLGDLLSLDGEHKQARQLMVEVFRASGDDKLATWHLGQMVERWVAQGDLDNAIISLQGLYEVSPSEAVLERLGQLYQAQSRRGEAVEIYRRLREIYTHKNDFRKALKAAELLVEIDPQACNDREVFIGLLESCGRTGELLEQKLQLAKAYRDGRQVDKAKSLLKEVLSAQPSMLDAVSLLVELYLQGQELELAELHEESLAGCFLEQKAYSKAIKLYEYWLRTAPESTRTRERLAHVYQLDGDFDGAKLEWLLAAESYQSSGDFERSARALERALELDPCQRDWRLRLARLKAHKLQQVESALAEFRLLFAADPDWRGATVAYLDLLIQEGLLSELGGALKQIEKSAIGEELKEKALVAVRSRMSADPQNLSLAFGWGELCLSLGSLDLAIEQFQRLRRHSELRLHSYRMLGFCFSKKKGFNMLELALSQFKKGLLLENESRVDLLRLRYDMASVLRDHGRKEASLEQFRLCALEDPDFLDVQEQIQALLSAS